MEFMNTSRLEVTKKDEKLQVMLVFKQEEAVSRQHPNGLKISSADEIFLGEYDTEEQVKEAVDLFASALSETRIKFFRESEEIDEGYTRVAETKYIHNTSVFSNL